MTELARTPKQIGAIIRRARKQRGWTQTELGARAGLRQETISLMETGNPAARLDSLLAVLAALGLECRVLSRSTGETALEEIF
ncbi:MAG: helix-turn-helix domain-containing protein [Rhodospirillaceae bacterium]|nr:helix-turn-helix domain-containing protein [Rhodospirillaceae bacterium]